MWAISLPSNDDVNESAMRTLAYLALKAGDAERGVEDVCWPSVDTIAKERGISRSQVFEHLNALAAAGLIAREKRPSSRVKQYRILWRESDAPDFQSPTDRTEDAAKVRSNPTPKEKTSTEETSEGAAMPSIAQDDLGGLASPADDPTPEQIAARRFPKQCVKHQTALSDVPCAGCGAARVEWPEVQRQIAQNRRAREVEAQRQAAALELEAVRNCSRCDERGYINGSLCRHNPNAVEESHRGYAMALAALKEAS